MANPQPDLGGYTDPGKPGWEDRLIDRVRESQRKSQARTSKGKRTWSNQVYADIDYGHYVRQAAQGRGISIGAYIRRAVAYQVARDLGIPVTEILRHAAAPMPFGQQGTPPGVKMHRTFDDSTGYGEWP